MSKTLQFWAGDFARRAKGIIDGVKDGAAVDRADMRRQFGKMIRMLHFGWAIIEDLVPAKPADLGLPEGIDFDKIAVETPLIKPAAQVEAERLERERERQVAEAGLKASLDSRWWKDKNRFTHFVNHVRRVLAVDMDMDVGKLLKKVAVEINIPLPANLPRGWANKKEKQKTFAQAMVTMLSVNPSWLGTNEEENLSYLLAGMENVLVRARAQRPVPEPIAPGLVVPTGSKLDVNPQKGVSLQLVKGGKGSKGSRHAKKDKTVKKTAARRRAG